MPEGKAPSSSHVNISPEPVRDGSKGISALTVFMVKVREIEG